MIQLIIGGMFSGKTTELIRRLTRQSVVGTNVVLLRPVVDNRIHLTHDKRSHDVIDITYATLKEADKVVKHVQVIGIDEGQFWPDLVKYANKWANAGKTVIVSGLNGTSEQTPFDNIQELYPWADTIDKLNAVCLECSSEVGAFSYYTGKGKEEDVLVGDASCYRAVCRKCLNRHKEDDK